MSSYVINKEEYIKAAGLICGVKKYNYRDEIWLYDRAKGRNMTKDDIYQEFVKCYEMNAKSVQCQYGDSKPEKDDNSYKPTFDNYIQRAYKMCFEGKMVEIMLALRMFFSSALYQVDNIGYNLAMEQFFNRILEQLIDKSFPGGGDGNWGEIAI